jgi:hypothetical protein
MGKDPAFLFYPGDWLCGTLGMSLEEKGAYLDLLIFQFNRNSFNENQAIRLVGTDNWQSIKNKFIIEDDGSFYNKRLREEKDKRSNYVESRRQSRKKTDNDNVHIYVVRDNIRGTYKIGSSVNPMKRYNELENQQNPAIMGDKVGERNITLVWYSYPVKRSIETQLHKLFKEKLVTGEWFSLDEKDLEYIYDNYKGVLCERMN